jgi:hypothetical protein
VDRAYVKWVDAYGAERLTWYSYMTGGVLTAFSLAIEACCNPVPAQVVAGLVQVSPATPTTDPYPNVIDSAVLTFATGLGSLVGVICPGFLEALYLADNQTVDIAQPLVIALVNACLSLPLVDSAGNVVLSYVSGLRQKRGY